MPVQGTLPRGYHPTLEQKSYRADEAARLWRECKLSVPQIALTLRPQVNESTVRADLRPPRGRLRPDEWAKRINGAPGPLPPPVDWLNPPAGSSAETRDRVSEAIRQCVALLHEARYESTWGNLVLEARQKHDADALAYMKRLLGDLRTPLETLELILAGDGRDLVEAITGWNRGGQSVLRDRSAHAVPAPRELVQEIRMRVDAGLKISRGELAERYGVSRHVVQREIERWNVIFDLLREGWVPPSGWDGM
jgi:hypothetical protein